MGASRVGSWGHGGVAGGVVGGEAVVVAVWRTVYAAPKGESGDTGDDCDGWESHS